MRNCPHRGQRWFVLGIDNPQRVCCTNLRLRRLSAWWAKHGGALSTFCIGIIIYTFEAAERFLYRYLDRRRPIDNSGEQGNAQPAGANAAPAPNADGANADPAPNAGGANADPAPNPLGANVAPPLPENVVPPLDGAEQARNADVERTFLLMKQCLEQFPKQTERIEALEKETANFPFFSNRVEVAEKELAVVPFLEAQVSDLRKRLVAQERELEQARGLAAEQGRKLEEQEKKMMEMMTMLEEMAAREREPLKVEAVGAEAGKEGGGI